MPEGITKILTHQEVLDLIRFVSELGKPGPYATREITTIQRWKVLANVPETLQSAEPNRELLREHLLRADAEAWLKAYSNVAGQLPLADLGKAKTASAIYLQGEFRLLRPGQVQIEVHCDGPVSVWLDEEPLKAGAAITTGQLEGGLHKVTVRIPPGSTAESLKIEVRRPAGAASNIEILHTAP
jgi:hypothetical protein